jgi:hypothetical protein
VKEGVQVVSFKPRSGDAFLVDSKCVHQGIAAESKKAIVFMATRQVRLLPLVLNAWDARWVQKFGTKYYSDRLKPTCLEWTRRRKAGVHGLPTIITPEIVEAWNIHK